MSSLSPKDRVSLCSFAFADGRRCRTPRADNHPSFCFYHAQKEDRARAAQKLGKDLDYFFSADYLSACDLSTALSRLIPAVVRGDVKPKTAHTVAYLAQTLMQAIHVSQHEYCEAFGSDGWRRSIRNSVNHNYNYRFPPVPEPQQPAPSALRTNLRSESPQPQPASPPPQPQPSASSSNSSLATHHSPLPQASQPAASPHTSLPPTSAEFVQRVVAGRNLSRLPRPGRGASRGSKIPTLSGPSRQTGGRQAPQPAQPAQPVPAQTRSPIPAQATPAPVAAPQTPAPLFTPPSPASHPTCPDPVGERSEEPAFSSNSSLPQIPSTPFAPPASPVAQPGNPPQPAAPPTPPPVRNLDISAYHYDHNGRLLIDGKPF